MNIQQFIDWCQTSVAAPILSPAYRRKPLIMGILNITPDSFSDGGCFLELERAYQRAQILIEQGADLIDIGGESTRPGAIAVTAAEEMKRILPIIERIRAQSDICISVDTYKSEVMRAAIHAGASMINDVMALSNEGSLATAAELDVPVCLMHMQGWPSSMQSNPQYPSDVVKEINHFFHQRIQASLLAGIF